MIIIILLVSNKSDITTDYLVCEFYKRDVPFFRFNTEDYPLNIQIQSVIKKKSFNIFLKDIESTLNLNNIASIWYWRPEIPNLKGIDIDKANRDYSIKESFFALENLWASLDVFWINNPFDIKKAENKQLQLKKAIGLGFKVPNTIISNNHDDIEDFYQANHKNIIIKPIGTSKITYKDHEEVIYTNLITESKIKKLDKTLPIPSIYQENIAKKYDIRVTIVGDQLFPVEIHSQSIFNSKIDWRKSDDKKLIYKKHILPKDIGFKCLRMLNVFNLSYAAIDLILTPKGEYYFLEINPNGLWAWIENRTEYKISKAIADLLCSKES